MAGEGDAERLVVLLEARIRDFEKNMAKEGSCEIFFKDQRWHHSPDGSASARFVELLGLMKEVVFLPCCRSGVISSI